MSMKRRVLIIIVALAVMSLPFFGYSQEIPEGSFVPTDYYYYQDEKIPLALNENKISICIPKDSVNISTRILENVSVLDKIKDDKFDIFVIPKSDLDILESKDFWGNASKSVIITPGYYISNGMEVFSSPYIMLQLFKGEDLDILNKYSKRYGFEIIGNDSIMPLWYVLSITPESEFNTLECANKLWESGKFASSEPDLCSKISLCSNDPLFSQQWGLYNSNYTGIDISVDSAWSISTGKDIKIAIFDDGIDVNHVDLASNVGSLSFDTETNYSPSGLYGDHGTHCAGIAAAIKDNNLHIAGVAPEATIVPISNSMTFQSLNPCKLANGFIWAYQNGVDIISNSWIIYTPYSVLTNAIRDALIYGRQGKGCVVVFSSGNDTDYNIPYPANCNDSILVVGAIKKNGTRWADSNYGNKLDVVAPGVNIISTIPNNTTGYNTGTSMACPHVAGVAALILELNPGLTVNQVNSIINSNAKKLSGVNFNITKPDGLWNNEYGYGLVDAYSSVMNTPRTVYIQNETINGTRNITADSIYVGKDVTNLIGQGDVILGPGNITLKADYIEIKNSTTVPLGTTLKVEN